VQWRFLQLKMGMFFIVSNVCTFIVFKYTQI